VTGRDPRSRPKRRTHSPLVARLPQLAHWPAYGRFKKPSFYVASHLDIFRMLPHIKFIFACCRTLNLFSHVASHWIYFRMLPRIWIYFRMLPHIKFIFACCITLENFIPKLIIHHTPPLSPKAQTHFNPWRHAVDDSIPTSVYLESKSVPLQPVCMQHRGRVRMRGIACRPKCISAVGVGRAS
jgi:hypothetical protein